MEPHLAEAKEAFHDIMPRMERSPTAVHLIGPREYSTQIFGLTDDFVFDDVSERWQTTQPALSCDVLFMLDITGSMQGAIDAARAKVIEVANGLRGTWPESRLGFLGLQGHRGYRAVLYASLHFRS